MSWSEYLEILANEAIGKNLKEGWVPATFFMAENDGILVDRASIHHDLNGFLFNVGGHIGFDRFMGHGLTYDSDFKHTHLGDLNKGK
jgi:predicted acetyltransferase